MKRRRVRERVRERERERNLEKEREGEIVKNGMSQTTMIHEHLCIRVSLSKRSRERRSVYVCFNQTVSVFEGERVFVGLCVCVCVRERERESIK
jgi:hypothetical protein